MKFATTNQDCTLGIEGCDSSSEITFRAGQTYVIPDYYTLPITYAMRDQGGHVRLSGIGHYTRPYHGQDLAGKTLLAWRGCGIGDQLMWGGLLAALAERHPTAQLDNLAAANIHHHLWTGARLPFRVLPVPLPREQWDAYDYHLIGEHLCESDREPDQPDVYTGMFRYAGIDSMLHQGYIPAPISPLRQVDRLFAAEWLASQAGSAGFQPASSSSLPHIAWQLSASTPIRTYSPWQTAAALRLLVQEFGSTHTILVLGTRRDRSEFAAALQTPGILIADDLDIRQSMALAASAAALVCPDSCLGHLAQAEHTPTVSLWGSFLPEDRVGYYSHHHPLAGQGVCSPCRTHEGGTPQGCPLIGIDPNACRYCKVIASITPQAIVSKLQEIL